jgi:hypothetical protein
MCTLLKLALGGLLAIIIAATPAAAEKDYGWPDRWEGKRHTQRWCQDHECRRPKPTPRNYRRKRDRYQMDDMPDSQRHRRYRGPASVW